MTIHPDIERLRAHREIEADCDPAPVSMDRMNEAELKAVLFHDPEISERRAAYEMLRLNTLIEAELRIMRVLAELRK